MQAVEARYTTDIDVASPPERSGGFRFHRKIFFTLPLPDKTDRTPTCDLSARGFVSFVGEGTIHFSIWRGSFPQFKGRSRIIQIWIHYEPTLSTVAVTSIWGGGVPQPPSDCG